MDPKSNLHPDTEISSMVLLTAKSSILTQIHWLKDFLPTTFWQKSDLKVALFYLHFSENYGTLGR